MYKEFQCKNIAPCSTDITYCWPVRPMEKTVFIFIWYTLSVVSICVAVFEIIEMGLVTVIKGYQNNDDITKEFKIYRNAAD